MFGEQIPEEEFKKMLSAYDEQNPGQTKSVLFSKEAFESILSSGASGIRIHFGNNEEGARTVILVGEGNASEETASLTPNTEIWDRGQLCPPNCP